MSRLLALLVLTGLCLPALAQNRKPSAKKLIREAEADYSEGLYGGAWQSYRRAFTMGHRKDKTTARAAFCAVQLNYPIDSLRVLEKQLQESKSHEALYYLAMISHQDRKFDAAIEHLKKYSAVGSGRRLFSDKNIALLESWCTNAKAFTSNPSPARIRNMGEKVNSRYADYVPVIMPDESALYFTSKRENHEHKARNGDGTFFEDVYVSHRNGSWGDATSVGFPINTETNDACVAISPDGQRMIIYRTSPDLATGDLYLTTMGPGGRWQAPQKMTDKINSPHIETSACFSNDTSEIFFSSDRPGGLGGKDLYRIRKLGNGEWSEPMNLGPSVNTPVDDDAPFLHPDGVTLHFSSRGHNSMGNFDVFRSTWSDDENKFSQAENLGHPINDVGNDIFFVLSVDGQRAYYTTSRPDDHGGTDIYTIDTRFSPNQLQVCLGRIVLGTSYGRARITLTDKETGEIQGYYLSNPVTGKFILAVNPHREYEAEIEAAGYNTLTTTFSPETVKNDSKLTFVLKAGNAP